MHNPQPNNPPEKTRYVRYDRRGSEHLRPINLMTDFFLGLIIILSIWLSFYIVGEGNRAIVTRFGEAIYQTNPGLHFKVPFINGVHKIEVRERKSVEELSAATKNQLPAVIKLSINWIINADELMDVYKRYGSLEQFENRILDPKLRQAGKAAASKFNADELIRDRQDVTVEILTIMQALMANYPVQINSPQIENIELPSAYMDSVLKKEQAREDASREQYNLAKQNLVAKQSVQTANAERDATKARADGVAYKITTEATAEAASIRLIKSAEAGGIREVEKALSSNPLFVDYTKALRWDGAVPKTVLGEGSNILLKLGN